VVSGRGLDIIVFHLLDDGLVQDSGVTYGCLVLREGVFNSYRLLDALDCR